MSHDSHTAHSQLIDNNRMLPCSKCSINEDYTLKSKQLTE